MNPELQKSMQVTTTLADTFDGYMLIILLIIFLFYKEFLVLSFDPLLAATLRLPARFLNYLLLML